MKKIKIPSQIFTKNRILVLTKSSKLSYNNKRADKNAHPTQKSVVTGRRGMFKCQRLK